MQVLQPPSWTRPRGFSNGIAVKGGKTVYITCRFAHNGQGMFEARDFAGQFHQTFRSKDASLPEFPASPGHHRLVARDLAGSRLIPQRGENRTILFARDTNTTII